MQTTYRHEPVRAPRHALLDARVRATRSSSAAVGIACAILATLCVLIKLPAHLTLITTLAALTSIAGTFFVTPERCTLINRAVSIMMLLALITVYSITPSLSTSLIAAPLLLQILFTENDARWRKVLVSLVAVSTIYAVYASYYTTVSQTLTPEKTVMIVKIHALIAGSLAAMIAATNRDINLKVNLTAKTMQRRLRLRVDEIAQANTKLAETHKLHKASRKQLHEALSYERSTQARLNAAHEQLEQFAYAASHDLKEPVRTIRSFTQLVRRQLSPKLAADTSVSELFNFVTTSCESMHTLLEKLLAYQRTGGVELVYEELPVDRLFRQAVQQEAKRLGKLATAAPDCYGMTADQLDAFARQQTSTTGLEASSGYVYLPVDHAETLFRELVRNALLYQDGTQIPEIECRAETTEEGLILSITDNGIGIEAAYHQQVFSMFKRLHPRERYPGSGLGLSLVKRIADDVNGEVWLESELSKGTTIHVRLPLRTAASS